MSVSQYCRLCAVMSDSYVDIFEPIGKRQLLFLKIMNNLNIVLSQEDPLSKCVCLLCIGKLNFTVSFRRDCQSSQIALRKMLNEKNTLQLGAEDVLKTKNIVSKEKVIESHDVTENNANSNCILQSVTNNIEGNNFGDENGIFGVKMEVEEISSGDSDNENDNFEMDDDFVDKEPKLTVNDQTDKDSNDNISAEGINENEGAYNRDDECNFDSCEEIIKTEHDSAPSVPDLDADVAVAVNDEATNDVQNAGNNCETNCESNNNDLQVQKNKPVCAGGDGDIGIESKSDKKDLRLSQDNQVSLYDDAISSLYFRPNALQIRNLTLDKTLYGLPYFINLIENKSSMMPYFIKRILQNDEVRFGFMCVICSRVLPGDRSLILKHIKKHFYCICCFCDNKRFSNVSCTKLHFKQWHHFESMPEKVKCQYCDHLFEDIEKYMDHAPCDSFKTSQTTDISVNSNESRCEGDKSNCFDCTLLFETEIDLTDHISKITNAKYICKYCDMIFHSAQLLEIHYRIFGDKHQSYKTNYSENIEATRQNPVDPKLQKLIGSVYGTRKYRKDIELIKFFQYVSSGKITKDHLPLYNINMQFNRTLGYKCPLCKNGFVVDVSSEKFRSHMQRHLMRVCYPCNMIWKQTDRFVKHFERRSHSINYKFECVVCENIPQFDNIIEYCAHVQKHLLNQICQYCQQVFLSSCKTRRHILKMHKDAACRNSNYKVCEHCSKEYVNVKEHIRIKHSSQTKKDLMLCSVCGNKYRVGFKCKCDKEQKTFICAYCSKVFKSRVSLVFHIKVHLNLKEFECIQCDIKFNRRSSLDKHNKDMHSKRKWQCEVDNCSSAFSFKSALITHRKQSHQLIE